MTGKSTGRVPIDRAVWTRFVRAITSFATSEVGRRAVLMSCALLALLLAINGLNVVNSYVGRDFMTAIATRSTPAMLRQALLYVGVFALSTIAAVTCRFAEERLGLLWRAWLTKRILDGYLHHRNYLHLRELHGDVLNPDQRIAEDTRTFVVMTISFVLMALNALFTVVAFSGVLFSISPLLWGTAIAYAALGSLATIALGRPLLWLNYDQSDREAALRAGLIHVRENAESIAMANREHRLQRRLQGRLDDVIANFKNIIRVNRNLGFFTTGYNYMIQIIPALIVAPLFIRGEVEFGVVTQSAMAFVQLVAAFSLIVTQFQSISSYAAVVVRLSRLVDAFEPGTGPAIPSQIHTLEASGVVTYENLSLHSRDDGHALVTSLSLSIPHGTRVLVVSAEEARAGALLRATAGLWEAGEGRILRPAGDRVMFVSERPYILPGTLRELLTPGGREAPVADDAIETVVHELGLEAVCAKADGLDVERDWDRLLALGEQQLLVLARVALATPDFAFLYRIDAAVGGAETLRVLRTLAKRSITYVTFAETDALASEHDGVLELKDDGKWTWTARQRQERRPVSETA